MHLENGLESYFNEWNVRNQHFRKLMSVPKGRRHVQTGVTPGQTDIIMFDVDFTTSVALFLTNILHIKPFDKKIPVQKLPRKPYFATVKI